MGEYIKYKGAEIKIGTLENLYYTSYEKYVKALKTPLVSKADGSLAPSEYAEPDSGFRFRFPFPDEDKLPFGDISGDYQRGIPVTVDNAALWDGDMANRQYQLEIVQQKLVHRQSDGKLCLAVVCRDPVKQESFRLEDKSAIKALIHQILKNHVMNEPDQEKKSFFRAIAVRVLKGYRFESPTQRMIQKHKVPRQVKRGRGLR
jgi:hypothetical protein